MTGRKHWEKQLYGLREKEGELTHGPGLPLRVLKAFLSPVVFGRKWYSLAGDLAALLFPHPQ